MVGKVSSASIPTAMQKQLNTIDSIDRQTNNKGYGNTKIGRLIHKWQKQIHQVIDQVFFDGEWTKKKISELKSSVHALDETVFKFEEELLSLSKNPFNRPDVEADKFYFKEMQQLAAASVGIEQKLNRIQLFHSKYAKETGLEKEFNNLKNHIESFDHMIKDFKGNNRLHFIERSRAKGHKASAARAGSQARANSAVLSSKRKAEAKYKVGRWGQKHTKTQSGRVKQRVSPGQLQYGKKKLRKTK